MNEAQTKGKILRRSEGVATVTQEMIEEHAHQIAQGDGRAEANDPDRPRANEDQTGSTSGPEQPSTVSERDPDWYTPRGSFSEKVPTVRPGDEENMPEKLVPEGIEEADHDQRSTSERISKK
jgi:hypothetical protein